MDDWISFEGCIVPMESGDSVYTVLPLPDDVTEALNAQGAKRVEVELNDVPFNMALTKTSVIDHVFVYAGKSVLAQAGVVPGDVLDVRMRKADPNVVDVPEYVALAVRQSDMSAQWAALSPGKMRGVLHGISTAKRAETRAKRIAALMVQLQQGALP